MEHTSQSRTTVPSRRAVLGLPGTAPAGAAGHVPRELRPGGEFDQYLADLADQDAFSGTVLVRLRGDDVLSRSHGLADKEQQIPHGPETIYTLGSVTKTITAIAVSQLAAGGALAYHDPLTRHVDGFTDPRADEVTVHHLLTHSSGFGAFYAIPGFWVEAAGWDSVAEFWEGILDYARRDQVTFRPGSSTTYSNTGFVALGAIVAAAGATSYYDYVREHVFDRAGMTDSGFLTHPEILQNPRIAHPYEKQNGAWVDLIDGDQQLFVGTPSGGSYATAADLAAFAEAVMDDTLLGDPGWTRLATTPKLPLYGDPEPTFAGYGLTCRLPGAEWSVAKNGGTKGVSANVEWFPESGWVAVVLSNYTKAAEPVADRLHTILGKG
ncbi:serine hydrolase [Jiangella sp. DSM 45060]|uniref:serine hydrolase domain-containing protein n=1 Tax=Jiangella sp. DSM 45060 TaxID=1798224 RepID=UPI00087CF0BE|nr:serine hydrolase domain-containing protein [Jiangella sp. DSM 45060]SDT47056.1 CubicO group peptidase, beta-lactamase class C family [Jiangella sp. DSM 45060]